MEVPECFYVQGRADCLFRKAASQQMSVEVGKIFLSPELQGKLSVVVNSIGGICKRSHGGRKVLFEIVARLLSLWLIP